MSARKVWRTVVAAFKSEIGKPEKRRNPWPLCLAGQHRVPPPLCRACGYCDGCHDTCGTCSRCTLACLGHKEEDQ